MLILVLFFTLLFFPEHVFFGATKGLVLWYKTVLPTLFPFIIITSLLSRTNSFHIISKILSYPLCDILHISNASLPAVVSGFFCGYPMGAKVIADLIEQKHISENEGAYLLSFCNNASPMFWVSYVIYQTFSLEKYVLPVLIIVYLTPIICSFGFRNIHKFERKATLVSCSMINDNFFSVLDQAVGSGCELITKIGGYLMIFSIIAELCLLLPFTENWWYYLVIPSLEMTNGINQIMASPYNTGIQFILVVFNTSFGGICAFMQTFSVLKNTNISKKVYIIEKLITAMVTSLIIFIFFCIIR